MGIRSLNRFLQNKCKNLLPTSLEDLRNKIIAIDANNYLYQIINGNLLQNIDDACKVFKKYNIEPLFIFDGPPPDYKKNIIRKRRNYFTSLHSKHNILTQIKDTGRAKNIDKTMHIIENKMRKLSSHDIKEVKAYLEVNNYKYVVTTNEIEADTMCVDLVKNKTVYAVLSEDMDIVGMGCPMTIRYFDKTNEMCVYYDIDNIVNNLGITIDEFKKMCTMVSNKISVEKAFELIKT